MFDTEYIFLIVIIYIQHGEISIIIIIAKKNFKISSDF